MTPILKVSSDAMEELGVFEQIDKFVNSDKDGMEWLSNDKAASVKRLTGRAYRLFSEVALEQKNRVL